MKRAILSALAVLCLPGLACAADLPPVKAQPNFFGPYNGSGWYIGIEAGGGASKADVSGIPGVNPASVVSAQGFIGGVLGYSSSMANGARYWFAEADVGWNNINGNTSGFSMSGPVTVQLLAGVGAPAAQLLSILPTFGLTPPTLPQIGGATQSNPHVYLAPLLDISDVSANYGQASNMVWQFAPGIALGLDAQLSTGGVLGARVETVFQMDGTCVGAVCRDPATVVRAKTIYKF